MATDTRTNHENLFTHGLSTEDESQLERTSTDAVTSTRAFEQAQATRDQYGVSASYRADHLGQALVSHPTLMAGARQEFMQRFGYLNGDLDRVSDKYKHLLGPDKAEAFGMVSLLVGHDKPTIARMSQAEQQSAAASSATGSSPRRWGAPVTGVNPYATRTGEQGPRLRRDAGQCRGGWASGPTGRGPPTSRVRRRRTTARPSPSSKRPRGSTPAIRHGSGQPCPRPSQATGAVQRRPARGPGAADPRAGAVAGSLPQWTVEQVGGFFKKFSDKAGLRGHRRIRSRAALQSVPHRRQRISLRRHRPLGAGWSQARQEVVDTRMAQVGGRGSDS